MIRARAARLGVLCAWLASTGCMTLREIPRNEFTQHAERKGVRVETRDGLVYGFDWASFTGDTLVGYRNRPEAEGAVDQVTVVRVPFDEVQRLTHANWTGSAPACLAGAWSRARSRSVCARRSSAQLRAGVPALERALEASDRLGISELRRRVRPAQRRSRRR